MTLSSQIQVIGPRSDGVGYKIHIIGFYGNDSTELARMLACLKQQPLLCHFLAMRWIDVSILLLKTYMETAIGETSGEDDLHQWIFANPAQYWIVTFTADRRITLKV